MARKHETRGTSYDTKSRSYWLTVHYLGLGYPAETVAEIVGMSVEYVRGVEELESGYRRLTILRHVDSV